MESAVESKDDVQVDLTPEAATQPVEEYVRQPGLFGYLHSFYVDPWFQILLISLVCFCCPGMYNALGGMGGSGQVDPTVAANATVALLSVGAVTAIFVVGPAYDLLGPRLSLLLGGWTYALYSGSLLNFNHHQNAAFVIAAGALLGIGAAFLWIPQGVIMTSYVPEHQKGRAIAVFWIIFNFGGGIGSLASFGLNFHSKVGTVTDSTYIAYIVIMLFGWIIGSLFLCPPNKLNRKYHGERVSKVSREYEKLTLSKIMATGKFAIKTLTDWKLLALLPMFFYANVFYSYQQNSVNGHTFNIRTRSLNGALYWFAQMFGGFVMGGILDLQRFDRKRRAMAGWAVLFVTGMVIWGGGYKFQLWADARTAKGLIQDVDFKDSDYIGPMFLYIFYGAYDAFWQSFCYWMIGTKSNSPAISGILVGSYKAMQSTGGAMAWRVNALKVAPMAQLAMNWGLTAGTLVVAIPAVLSVTQTSGYEDSTDDDEKA
jgi:MFS family permease